MRYADIKLGDMMNGEGVRISIFVQGCSHHCKGCFNKESWDFNKGKIFTKDILDITLKHLDKYNNIYSGLSILGGEPLDNLEMVNLIVTSFRDKFPNKTIWVWSGYIFEDILKDKNKLDVISKCNVLIDGRFEEDLKDVNLIFRGSSNQRILDIQESMASKKIVLLSS